MTTVVVLIVVVYIIALIAQSMSDREYDKLQQERRGSKRQLPINLYSKYSWCEDSKRATGDSTKMTKAKLSSVKAPQGTKSPGHVFDFDDVPPKPPLPTKPDLDTPKWELLPQADKEFIDDEDIPF